MRVYQQYTQNYPVLGYGYFVTSEGGVFRSANGKVMPGLPSFPDAKVSSSSALQTALSSIKLAHQALPSFVGLVVLVLALVFILWRRVEMKHLLAGALIGLLVPLGYLVTGGLGGDEFEPATVESIKVTRGGGGSLSPTRVPGSHHRPVSFGCSGSRRSTIIRNWSSFALCGVKSFAPVER